MLDVKNPHLKIFGYSDDLIEVYDEARQVYAENGYRNEIDCLRGDAILEFTDGTTIRVHYGKNNDTRGIWAITVLQQGKANHKLTICDDEEADIYSDIFEIDAKIWTLDRVSVSNF